jgi:hypothetical protein
MSNEPRRSLPGVYRWAVPAALGLMVLILFGIVVAVLAAAVGLWPVH